MSEEIIALDRPELVENVIHLRYTVGQLNKVRQLVSDFQPPVLAPTDLVGDVFDEPVVDTDIDLWSKDNPMASGTRPVTEQNTVTATDSSDMFMKMFLSMQQQAQADRQAMQQAQLKLLEKMEQDRLQQEQKQEADRMPQEQKQEADRLR